MINPLKFPSNHLRLVTIHRHQPSLNNSEQLSKKKPSLYDTIYRYHGCSFCFVFFQEDETIICFPSLLNNQCETLQDFLRVEEMKTKEFQLDCQRIGYRLAKIQDCIGSILN